MEQLVSFLARGLVAHPDDIQVNLIEGEAVAIVELKVHEDDVSRLTENGERHLMAMRQVLAAASGRRKTALELVNTHAPGTEE